MDSISSSNPSNVPALPPMASSVLALRVLFTRCRTSRTFFLVGEICTSPFSFTSMWIAWGLTTVQNSKVRLCLFKKRKFYADILVGMCRAISWTLAALSIDNPRTRTSFEWSCSDIIKTRRVAFLMVYLILNGHCVVHLNGQEKVALNFLVCCTCQKLVTLGSSGDVCLARS